MREVQNRVDMDRVMDSGDVSGNESETIVHLRPSHTHTPNAESSPPSSVFAVSLFSTPSPLPPSIRTVEIHIPYISNDRARDARAMYYRIMTDPRGKTWYVLEPPQQFDATRITRK